MSKNARNGVALVAIGIVLLLGLATTISCSAHKESATVGVGARLTYETRVTLEISYEHMAFLRDLVLEGKGLVELVAAVVGVFK